MPDLDLGILEILIAFLLFMPVIRPFVKTLRPVEGFFWFPPAALLCALGMFLVYGFRPECLPLLVYIIIVNITNLPGLLAFLSGLRNTDFTGRGFLSFCANMLTLSLVTGAALLFLPTTETALIRDGVETSVQEDYGRARSFTVRVYGEAPSAGVPVVLAVPPVTGSVGVIDHVCDGLARRGVIVVSYSRKEGDLPAYKPDGGIYLPSMEALSLNWKVITGGRRYQKENALAREMETERTRDIVFMARYIEKRWPEQPLVIAGYGVSGAAAAYLSADESFVAAYPALRGVLAVESYLYASFTGAPPEAADYTEEFLPFRALNALEDWARRSRALKISGVEEAPRPLLPLVFMVSSAPKSLEGRDSPYAALEKTARRYPDLVTIRALSGGTLFDWTDIPQKYPALRFAAGGFTAGSPHGEAELEQTLALFQSSIAALVSRE